jgi:hypothetical protein
MTDPRKCVVIDLPDMNHERLMARVAHEQRLGRKIDWIMTNDKLDHKFFWDHAQRAAYHKDRCQ